MLLGIASQLIKMCSQSDDRKREKPRVTGIEKGSVFYFRYAGGKKLSLESGQREP